MHILIIDDNLGALGFNQLFVYFFPIWILTPKLVSFTTRFARNNNLVINVGLIASK